MKTLIIAIMIVVGLIPMACELEEYENYLLQENDIIVEDIYDYDFENDIPEFETILEAARWIKDNMIYIPDDINYWQTPEETYNRIDNENKMQGDCEDYAIIFQYIIETRLHIPTYSARIEFPNSDNYHLIPYINGYYYEISTDGSWIIPLEHLREDIKIHWIAPYSEILWMTINYHDSIGKYE